MEYIVAFENTNSAIKAEHILLEKQIPVSVMPLPPSIRAGCGICLRVAGGQLDLALEILRQNQVSVSQTLPYSHRHTE